MWLVRKDIEKIKEILDKFPDIDAFRIESDNSSGIGSCTYMTFEHEVEGVKGEFTVEIAGVEDW